MNKAEAFLLGQDAARRVLKEHEITQYIGEKPYDDETLEEWNERIRRDRADAEASRWTTNPPPREHEWKLTAEGSGPIVEVKLEPHTLVILNDTRSARFPIQNVTEREAAAIAYGLICALSGTDIPHELAVRRETRVNGLSSLERVLDWLQTYATCGIQRASQNPDSMPPF